MVLKFLTTISKAVAAAAKFVTPHTNKEIISTTIVTTENSVITKLEKNIELEQLKLQYIQNIDNFDLPDLSQANTQELQAFIQIAETAKLQTNIDFQRWLLEH